jgi:23S rRNA (guanosine2251-2'-O)-methyltransferase
MNKLYLILPNIRSAHNVGSMFRTADAFGVEKLFLVGYTAHPPHTQIDKVSLGAETWVSWESCEDVVHCIKKLKREGCLVVGLEKTETSELLESGMGEKRDVALIVGNEVDGIDPSVLLFCDNVVHIPMQGKKESLNVSVATGIALYALRQS